MPTNRQKRTRTLRDSCPRGIWHVQIDDPLPPGDQDFNPFQNNGGRRNWDKYREQVLSYWTKKHPGTRPSRWWLFEVPLPRPETQKEKLLYLKNNDFLTEYEQKTLKTAQKWAKKD
jgi:hypothetical protein